MAGAGGINRLILCISIRGKQLGVSEAERGVFCPFLLALAQLLSIMEAVLHGRYNGNIKHVKVLAAKFFRQQLKAATMHNSF